MTFHMVKYLQYLFEFLFCSKATWKVIIDFVALIDSIVSKKMSLNRPAFPQVSSSKLAVLSVHGFVFTTRML